MVKESKKTREKSKCHYCNKFFSDRSSMRKHVLKMYKKERDAGNPEKIVHPCPKPHAHYAKIDPLNKEDLKV